MNLDYKDDKITLLLGNCLDRMKELEDNSVDSVVTDPPYAFAGGFMGKDWDNFDGREDAAFGYWLAGFTDGEAAFMIKKHERGSHTCTFQIKLRRDDTAILKKIKDFVGYGSITNDDGDGVSKPLIKYMVQDKEGCDALVSIFRKYPLSAKKANDFEIWAEAVEEWLDRPRGNRWSGQSDQSKAANLKERLGNVRKYVEIPWSGHRFQDWTRQWATECLRVLKPGGYLVSFCSTKQHHRMTTGLEDAGFEIRDMIAWIYAQGMPKHKSCLKPALEPITLARKPAKKATLLNIEECRVEGRERTEYGLKNSTRSQGNCFGSPTAPADFDSSKGRYPSNVITDGSEEVFSMFPDSLGAGGSLPQVKITGYGEGIGTGKSEYLGGERTPFNSGSGSAARFYYVAKANKKDRGEWTEEVYSLLPETPDFIISEIKEALQQYGN